MIIPEFDLPISFTNFILVAIFSLIIGLSQRRLQDTHDISKTFGTDRTFTFIGILGYLLYIIRPDDQILFIVGFVIITLFLLVFYVFKIKTTENFGLTSIAIALVTYCIGPLLITQPFWFFLLIISVVLILTELKESFLSVSKKFNKDEFLTLAKFIVMAGVILPIVPDTPFVSYLSLTPYKVWMAVVVISSISYVSYLLKKFIFPDSGVILTGVLGGLYSSTATTIILARKMKELEQPPYQYIAAIIVATAMMYLRILFLILIFNQALFNIVWVWFLLMFVITSLISFVITLKYRDLKAVNTTQIDDKNPLEIRVAILFTVLFIAFTFLTHFTIREFGATGLNLLSIVVGVTDIDPFLLNLFQGQFTVPLSAVALATFQAIISNNILKVVYAITLSGRKDYKLLVASFGIIVIVNLFLLLFV